MSQSTNSVLTIEPRSFGVNPDILDDNDFVDTRGIEDSSVAARAHDEFDHLRQLLEQNHINVTVAPGAAEPPMPDAVFPNNWFSTHPDGTLVLYPMMAPSRRLERRPDIITTLQSRYSKTIDLTQHEQHGYFLEGTGSLVLDRVNRVAYAALSKRTALQLLTTWCSTLGYRAVPFTAIGSSGLPIYHTNIVMSVGTSWAIVCWAAIKNAEERRQVMESLLNTGHRIIDISVDQLRHFCGNVLELTNKNGQKLLVCSISARDSLSAQQRQAIEHDTEIIAASIPTIERVSGGSVRCMLAELF